ncbi:MAG: hypothetical protein EXR76_10110 [Myxococcales bacterium]|nr:hypothetical protein [Myxococcales bacterium]
MKTKLRHPLLVAALIFVCACQASRTPVVERAEPVTSLYVSPRVVVSVLAEAGAEPFDLSGLAGTAALTLALTADAAPDAATAAVQDALPIPPDQQVMVTDAGVVKAPRAHLLAALEANLAVAFAGRLPLREIVVEDVVGLEAQAQAIWSDEALENLAAENVPPSDNLTSRIVLVFVRGAAEAAGLTTSQTTSDGTVIIGVMKDALSALATRQQGGLWVESLAVSHALGHALGLVNHGVPMRLPHEDPGSVGHCENPNCVMSAAIESGAGLLLMAKARLQVPTPVVFGRECLDDTQTFAPFPPPAREVPLPGPQVKPDVDASTVPDARMLSGDAGL